MTPADVISDLRILLDDTVADYLWEDAELEGFVDEAYREFARKNELLTDMSTANVAVYSVGASSASIASSPLIVDIRRAFDVTNELEFGLKNSNEMPMVGIPESEVRYIITDREKDKIFFYPKPADAFTLTLQVVRYPLETFSLTGMSNPLEFTEERAWRIALLYAASRAYLKDDVETVDRLRSRELRAQFEAEVLDYEGDVRKARRQTGTIQYGGL